MFRDSDDPESAAFFIDNWGLEIRAGFTPADELDVRERLREYLDPDDPPEIQAKLTAEVTAASEQLFRAAHADEARWSRVTMNDRLTAAFAALDAKGIFAKEAAGVTLQDGWGYVGLEAKPRHRGAIFYHQEDVFDALEGKSLLFAFGGCGKFPGRPAEDAAVAEAALEVFSRNGIPAEWSGRVEDRIAVAPFAWQRRRWTKSPRVDDPASMGWQRTGHQLGMFPVPDSARLKYEQALTAYRTCYGFDRWLSSVMRGAWTLLGGERGQFGHTGHPHVFVPAGAQTTVAPQNALTNLPPDVAAAIRSRAIDVRPKQRAWWRLWS